MFSGRPPKLSVDVGVVILFEAIFVHYSNKFFKTFKKLIFFYFSKVGVVVDDIDT